MLPLLQEAVASSYEPKNLIGSGTSVPLTFQGLRHLKNQTYQMSMFKRAVPDQLAKRRWVSALSHVLDACYCVTCHAATLLCHPCQLTAPAVTVNLPRRRTVLPIQMMSMVFFERKENHSYDSLIGSHSTDCTGSELRRRRSQRRIKFGRCYSTNPAEIELKKIGEFVTNLPC
jgi:hypothetical protein